MLRSHVLLAVALYLSFAGCSRPPTVSDEIKAIYRRYCDAIARGDGAEASSMVSRDTLQRYQEFRDLALAADEATLGAAPVSTRLQVLLLRQRMDAATLAPLDGAGLFAHFIGQKWLDPAGFAETQLGQVAVDEDRAQAPVQRGDRLTRERMYFVRESGAWKVNLLPNLTTTDRHIQEAAVAKGVSEREYLESLVAEVTKEPVGEGIWQPLQ
jgi:hypothetical protein